MQFVNAFAYLPTAISFHFSPFEPWLLAVDAALAIELFVESTAERRSEQTLP